MGNVGLQYLQWHRPLSNEDVAWSLDSTRIAYVTNPLGNWDVAVADARGGGSRVFDGDPFDQLSPIWQTDGRVAFIDGRDYSSASYNVDDGGATWWDMWYPTPSPDGEKLAYIDEFGHLIVEDGAGSRVVEEAEFVVGNWLDWSADSSTLLYVRNVEVDNGKVVEVVFTYRDGVSSQVFPRQEDEASWFASENWVYARSLSPDGRQLALNVVGYASAELRVVDVANGDSTTVDLGMRTVGVDWGSSGWIVFRGFEDGALWMIEGTNPLSIIQVSVPPTFDSNPEWSPDGQWIAFERDAEGGSEIWTVNPFIGEWHRVAAPPTRP